MKLSAIVKKTTVCLLAAAVFAGLGGTASSLTTSRTDNLYAYAETFSAGSKADIVFVIDSTGSMDPYIQSVKENLINFVDSLRSRSVELNMAVVEYRDIFVDGDSSTVYYDIDGSHWTGSADKVVDVFNSIEVDGGGDLSETPTDAFEKIFADSETWYKDEEASKFIFLLTDADYKNYGDKSMEYWTEVMRDNNIKATVVGQLEDEPAYNYLYTLTGGQFIDITSSDYYELMQEFSEWIYESAVDSDGDGLPDDWEINGVDTDHDGVVDLDLPAMGADPNVPDIFVEADWMEYEGDDYNFLWIHEKRNQKNTSPSASAMARVHEQFASHGIELHIDFGPDSIMNYDTGETWGSLSGGSAIPYQEILYTGEAFENWNDIALENFTRQRWTTFRYCLFVDQYDAGAGHYSSGIAENLPGQFFIVAKGITDTVPDPDTALAGTFMHELGHTLGLSHGGLYYSADTGKLTRSHNNYKPNHLSIMNYTYQFGGLATTYGRSLVDYQDFSLPSINENHIIETLGIDPEQATEGRGLTAYIWLNRSKFRLGYDISGHSVDFNFNGHLEMDVQFDLNQDGLSDELLTGTLDEWDNLSYKGTLIGGYGDEIDPYSVTTLIEYPDNAEELEILNEISIHEAYENGLIGTPGECEIRNYEDAYLFTGPETQQLYLMIANCYPEPASIMLTISSELLSDDYTQKLDIAAYDEIDNNTIVSVPIDGVLTEGSYDAEYKLTFSDESESIREGVVHVIEPESVSMAVGDTAEIDESLIVSCVSSDNSIVEVSEDHITALANGTAYVIALLSSGETSCSMITVGEGGASGGVAYSNEDTSHSAVIVISLALAAAAAIFALAVVFIVKKSRAPQTDNDEDISVVYANGAESAQSAQDGKLYISSGSMQGSEISMSSGDTIVIGKDPARVNLVLGASYTRVSRVHCTITYHGDTRTYYVTDHSTKNGTYAGANVRLRPEEPTAVPAGTLLTLGDRHCTIMLR